jgi:O-antigen/teichoic acid export membrane protein
MVHVTATVVALKTITLVLGGLITYFAFKAYHRTGARALRALALGFGTVTLGSLLAGVVDRLLQTASTAALVVESALTAVGFAIVLYSLYTE